MFSIVFNLFLQRQGLAEVSRQQRSAKVQTQKARLSIAKLVKVYQSHTCHMISDIQEVKQMGTILHFCRHSSRDCWQPQIQFSHVWSCGSGSVRFDAMQQGLVSCEFTCAWKCECTSRLPKESPLPPIAIEQSSVPESSCFVIEVIQVVSKACLLPRQRRGTIAADWRSETIWEVAIRYLWPIQATGTQTVWTGNEETQTKRCIHLWGVFDRVWPFCLGSCLSERWRLTDLMLVNPWGGWTFPMIFPLEVEFDRQTALLCFTNFSPRISGYIWLEIYKTMNT